MWLGTTPSARHNNRCSPGAHGFVIVMGILVSAFQRKKLPYTRLPEADLLSIMFMNVRLSVVLCHFSLALQRNASELPNQIEKLQTAHMSLSGCRTFWVPSHDADLMSTVVTSKCKSFTNYIREISHFRPSAAKEWPWPHVATTKSWLAKMHNRCSQGHAITTSLREGV